MSNSPRQSTDVLFKHRVTFEIDRRSNKTTACVKVSLMRSAWADELQQAMERGCGDVLKLVGGVLKPFCAKDLALTFITHADIFNARKVR